eukprot:11038213-Heterocapsa_arctica.AAC.1
MDYGPSGLAALARDLLRFTVAHFVSHGIRGSPAARPLNITCPTLHCACECPPAPAVYCTCAAAAPLAFDGAIVFAAGLAVGIIVGGLLEALTCWRRAAVTPQPAPTPAPEARQHDESLSGAPSRPLPAQRVAERGPSPPGGATPVGGKAALRAIEDLEVWVPPTRRSRA